MEKIPKEFWEDAKWAEKHYSELVKKFPDEWVAVVNREVVTAGKDLAKVKEEAKIKTGREKNTHNFHRVWRPCLLSYSSGNF
jgi:hypothetical protein